MKKNGGTADRIIRIIIGLVIIIWAYLNHSWWGLIGLIPLVTGIIGYCGIYAIFGIRTCKID